ncbi:MAG: cell division protein FtsQ, partial [Pseudomonas sp. PGPPP3]
MRAWLSLLALLPVTLLQAAEIPLYPTGPSEDSAFLRFFNAGESALELSAANGASLRLEGDARASDFLTVPAGKPIKGTLKQADQTQQLDISVAPGEFATVVGITTQQGLNLLTVREVPDDFNALKASLAFYSLDAACANAGLQVAGRNVDIFKDVPNGALQRRSINPLKLS